MSLPIALLLPYPPSDNERYAPGGYGLSQKVKAYHEEAFSIREGSNNLRIKTIVEACQAIIYLYPANDKRDSANCLKVLFDTLQKIGVVKDDKLIREERIIREEEHPSDIVFVELWQYEFDPPVLRNKTIEERWFDANMYEELTGKVFAARHVLDMVDRKERILKPVKPKRFRRKGA